MQILYCTGEAHRNFLVGRNEHVGENGDIGRSPCSGGSPGPAPGRSDDAYQQADHDAATQLVRLVSPVLFRYLIARVANRSSAEDLLQDCWLRIHKARHTYRPGEPLLPWIFAIAHHTRVDSYRRARRIESRELALDNVSELADSGQPDPVSSLTFAALLGQLPESQREVVFLLKVEGMSIEDIARASSTTVGAVKQKAHRAYAKLRAILSEKPKHSGKQ